MLVDAIFAHAICMMSLLLQQAYFLRSKLVHAHSYYSQYPSQCALTWGILIFFVSLRPQLTIRIIRRLVQELAVGRIQRKETLW